MTADPSAPAVVPVDPAAPDPATLARAADLLRRGRLVAFPTETVYGLGGHALDHEAVARIFAAKGRPAHNPLIVHVTSTAEARRLARQWPRDADRLAEAFWPGPVTLVVPRAPNLPDLVTAGLDAIAIRVPAHPVALALLAAAELPVAAPSANRSTRVSPTRAEHVAASLGDRVDLILDAGPTTVGIESTVLDLTGERPRILRPGMIGAEALAAVVGPVQRPDLDAIAAGTPRSSPGLDRRHYAPRARLSLAPSSDLAAEAARGMAEGLRVGALVHTPVALPPGVHVVRLADQAAGYARGLYDALHGFDADGCALVVVEALPDDAAWDGVRDRLARAAHRVDTP